MCAGLVGPRSYEVKVGDRNFVRHRRQLIKSSDHVVDEKLEEEPAQQENVEGEPLTPPESMSTARQIEDRPQPPMIGTSPDQKSLTPTQTRRFTRITSGVLPDLEIVCITRRCVYTVSHVHFTPCVHYFCFVFYKREDVTKLHYVIVKSIIMSFESRDCHRFLLFCP